MEKKQATDDPVGEQDATELPDREAMSLIDPGRMLGATGPATIAPTDVDKV
jgi:hypothetical protein